MKKSIVSLVALCSSLAGFGQVPDMSQIAKVSVMKDITVPFCEAWQTSDADTLDTSYLKILYQLSHTPDVASGKQYTDMMTLEVGTQWQHFYGMRQDINDKRVTISKSGGDPNTACSPEENEIAGNGKINMDILIDLAEESITERTHDFAKENTAITSREKRPKLEWQLLEETTEILGYNCLKATTTFGGRSWEVWYTIEIPVAAAPWKLSGLPGAVLQASDTEGHYSWKAAEITQEQVPIVRINAGEIKLSRKKHKQYIRQFYAAPHAMYSHEKIYVLGPDAKAVDESFSYAYNPIELN